MIGRLIAFVKDWMLLLAMAAGAAVYLIYINIPSLSGFGPRHTDRSIPLQSPVQAGETRVPYETGEEDIAGKTILAQGWVYGRFDEPEKNLACQALGEMLCGSDEAPL